MNIEDASSPTDFFDNTPSLAASAESEATNLDKLPMPSSLKQSKRKSETAAVSARQPKKLRSGKAASTSNIASDAEENAGPSELGALINAHGGETQTRPPQPRVSGRFTPRSTLVHTPTSSFASVSMREIRGRPSVLQNNSSSEANVDAFTNFPNVTQDTATNDKASKKSEGSDLRALQKDNVASKPISPALRTPVENLENEQVTSPTGMLLPASPNRLARNMAHILIDSMIPSVSPTPVAASLGYRLGFGTTATLTSSTFSLTPLLLSAPNNDTFSAMSPSTNLSSQAQTNGINNSTSNVTAITNVNGTPIPALNGPFNSLALANEITSSVVSQAPREIVQFYARVQTPNGFQAIALEPSLFTGPDVDLIHQYAMWKQEEAGTGMNLSYEQFCMVVGFAKMKVEE
jgi:hypothetical protein